MIFFILLIGLVPLFITSFTGGLAGAIAARGREDRSLLANAGIGLVGWGLAWVIWRLVNGQRPEEITLGLGLLALLISVAFIHLLEKLNTQKVAATEKTLTV